MSGSFNPWLDPDTENDFSEQAPGVRAAQLECYLAERVGRAKLLLVEEAPGFRGARFSDIAMTSERMLAGEHVAMGANLGVSGVSQRNSNAQHHVKTFTEPMTSIAWSLLLQRGLDAREFVFWNAFPCHPHKPGQPLTNRAPCPGSWLRPGISWRECSNSLLGQRCWLSVVSTSEPWLSWQ
ncbi:MAG: hypothetical protein Q8S12_10285 [Hydrogenophaga sp.]|uniref:hypothetical protein n=1 Tax=Hydrogenophaga sp. TaxID=1904254 RepID=UPI002734E1C7|nr:hypothetical protein [Hydrogenophaga sp.]MDP3626977.1 hypothetical protein [Hydrogenophaga sp.]